jgi:hypothetical protein
MDLDVARYPLTVDDKDSILKIAAGDVAASARVDYLNLLAGIGNQSDYQVALPDMGNKLFCHLRLHVLLTRWRVCAGKKLFLFRWYPGSFFIYDVFYLPAPFF